MHANDVQLLIDAHRGHEPSARALWNNHAPRLLAFARTIVRERADAEDVVQSAMCRMLELPARDIRQVRDAAAWLAQLTRRTALNHLREHRRRRTRDLSAGEARSRPTEDAPPSAHLPSDLVALIDQLPRRLREIIVLKHIGGLTFDQIALALDLNRNTAAARHRAAVALLRKFMDPQNQATPPSHAAVELPREVEHV